MEWLPTWNYCAQCSWIDCLLGVTVLNALGMIVSLELWYSLNECLLRVTVLIEWLPPWSYYAQWSWNDCLLEVTVLNAHGIIAPLGVIVFMEWLPPWSYVLACAQYSWNDCLLGVTFLKRWLSLQRIYCSHFLITCRYFCNNLHFLWKLMLNVCVCICTSFCLLSSYLYFPSWFLLASGGL